MPSVVARCTATVTLATALPAAASLSAQPRPATVPVAATPIITKSFGDLGAGPYKALVIRNAMVIPGHGGPPAGPYDIKVEGNLITEMVPFDPVTAERAGARP
ncbi:MAG: hypothetical protein ACK5U0_12440, partial [Gemmatimonas sp.]